MGHEDDFGYEDISFDVLPDGTDDNYFDEISADNETTTVNPRKGMNKQLILLGVIGLAVIIAIAGLTALLTGRENPSENIGSERPPIASAASPSTPKVSSEASTPVWTEVSLGEFRYESTVVLEFTVAETKTYARMTDYTAQLKTVVTGTIDGYTGKYEVEVPGNKASRLLKGNTFKIAADVYSGGQMTILENCRTDQ